MPELPDVELFKRLVDQYCLGRVIAKAVVADPGSLKGISPTALQERLKGKRLSFCRRHGKVLFIETGSAGALAMHFGTNGSLDYLVRDQSEPPYVRLWFGFADGDRLAYVNPRRIGHVQLVESSGTFIANAGLGPDALDASFDAAAFAAALGKGKQAIKPLLMDQTRMAGIGNIYADEILFQAKLHPATRANTLDSATRRHLFQAMKSVLQTAIDRGTGAEIFMNRLPNGFLLSERRADGRCPRCGTAIQADKRSGRTGYFCPNCQPRPGR